MKYYALVDANSFYAACERVFNPSIRNRPVIVLSNNDGCVIARTQEAKDLGISMGISYFEIEKLVREKNVVVYSSNYALYGSMSNRVMNVLFRFCPDVEVYSIDEAFLEYNFWENSPDHLFNYSTEIRTTLLQWLHLPTCVGIGQTKTLAKLANHVAKKHIEGGVYLLTTDDPILKRISIDEIWGVGAAYKLRLAQIGVESVADLQKVPEAWMQKEFGIVGLRMLKELNGFPCYDLEPPVVERQHMVVSRAFRRDVYKLEELTEAASVYATRIAEKLRRYKQIAGYVTVFLIVNPFKNKRKDGKQYFSQGFTFPLATSNTNEIISWCVRITKYLYETDTNYKKLGVMVSSLKPETSLQMHLFIDHQKVLRNKRLMVTIDYINRRWGRNTIYFASCGRNHTWSRKEQWRSPRYTTRLDEVMWI